VIVRGDRTAVEIGVVRSHYGTNRAAHHGCAARSGRALVYAPP
jgi:hypothetical protein